MHYICSSLKLQVAAPKSIISRNCNSKDRLYVRGVLGMNFLTVTLSLTLALLNCFGISFLGVMMLGGNCTSNWAITLTLSLSRN